MHGMTGIRNVIFSAATVLALGFGAAQAFAAPQPAAKAAEKAAYCDYTSCNFNCRQLEGAAGGYCQDWGGRLECVCYY